MYMFPIYTVFHVRDEVKWSMVLGGGTISIFIVLSIALNVRPQTPEYCVQAAVAGIVLYLFSAIPTGYALYRFKLPRNYLRICCAGNKHLIDEQYMAEYIDSDVNTNSNDKDQSITHSDAKISLIAILEDSDGFELFARHLSREFAIVC